MVNDILYTNLRQYNAFVNGLLANGAYRVCKLSTMYGYISRKYVAVISHYDGKYGIGYCIHKPRYDTTGFHDVIFVTKAINA